MEEVKRCGVSSSDLPELAKRLADELRTRDLRVVFCESCTAGLVAATMGQIAGISQWLCGSAVVYRIDTKVRWLGVSKRDLKTHSPVSEPIARQMAEGVLRQTPEAHWAASVTGHLGPAAPPDLDGVLYVALAARRNRSSPAVECWRTRLTAATRRARQRQAAAFVLDRLYRVIHSST